MKNISGINGLMTFSEREIITRNFFVDFIEYSLRNEIQKINNAISFYRIESPCIINIHDIDESYSKDDFFSIESCGLSLRPETTKGTYSFAIDCIKSHGKKLPFILWQHGKSFRNEQDQVVKNVRLKEFYQLEFQFFYSVGSKCDYFTECCDIVKETLCKLFRTNKVKLVESDRLPKYSIKTMDVEYNEMELCSISKRKDFPLDDINVVEISTGTDRLLYQFFQI